MNITVYIYMNNYEQYEQLYYIGVSANKMVRSVSLSSLVDE